MGGWWPEHSTPDTGVRPTRQFTPACPQSSALSFGKFVFIITLQMCCTECWIVAVKIALGPEFHSFIGFHFHHFSLFSLDMCMLVEAD